jgi:hypothetical protein
MADAVKDAVNSAVEGVKNLSVAAEQKSECSRYNITVLLLTQRRYV